ncbi:MAG: hypothetical protein C4522_07030 [Desulfobacteraceae bacterium]|nr:MAG: hypothetical protein C4522_07030 [Desulfobacteraceae bacterium]
MGTSLRGKTLRRGIYTRSGPAKTSPSGHLFLTIRQVFIFGSDVLQCVKKTDTEISLGKGDL